MTVRIKLPKKCTHCDTTAETVDDAKELFGLRLIGKAQYVQPRCRPCRSQSVKRKNRKTEVVDGQVIITENRAQVKALFAEHFPSDQQSRSWRTMVNRLIVKIGIGTVTLTAQAQKKMRGAA